jgi:anthranilate/para-aminobenzoate synthase component I
VSRTDVCTCLASRDLDPGLGPLEAFESLRGQPCAWLLDSALDASPLAGFSFAGSDPYLVLRAYGRRIELDCRRAVHPGLAPGLTRLEGDVFEAARALLPRLSPREQAEGVPFVGGAVALLGYELAERLEELRLGGADDLELPDAVLLFSDRLLAWDHRRAWRAVGSRRGAGGASRPPPSPRPGSTRNGPPMPRRSPG